MFKASRGTEPNANDLITDGLLAVGLPALLKARIDNWRTDPAKLGNDNFTVTGHSLGGYLVVAVSYALTELNPFTMISPCDYNQLLKNRRWRRPEGSAKQSGQYLQIRESGVEGRAA